MDQVGGLGRDVDGGAVGGDLHTFRLLAQLDTFYDLAGFDIDERHGGVFLVGDIEGLAVRREIEGFRLLDAADALN